jgi:hypothetical protein
MVLLILVVLWAVVLTPHFVRKWLDRRPAESIESFHQQLHLLERAGPKLMPAAYRLETALPGAAYPVPAHAASSYAVRPNLVLLQPVDNRGASDGDDVVDEASGQHYRRLQPPVVPVPVAPVSAAPQVEDIRRRRNRRRRRDILLGLVSTMALTGLAGIAPSLHTLWVLTGLAGLALAAFVGLAAYAQLLDEDAAQPRHEPRHARRLTWSASAAGHSLGQEVDSPWYEEGYDLPPAAAAR